MKAPGIVALGVGLAVLAAGALPLENTASAYDPSGDEFKFAQLLEMTREEAYRLGPYDQHLNPDGSFEIVCFNFDDGSQLKLRRDGSYTATPGIAREWYEESFPSPERGAVVLRVRITNDQRRFRLAFRLASGY